MTKSIEKCSSVGGGEAKIVIFGHVYSVNDHNLCFLVMSGLRTTKKAVVWSFGCGEVAKRRLFGRSAGENDQKNSY